MPAPSPHPPPAAIVHDVVQVRLLGLMVIDTFQWKHDWAAWRIRFAVDNDVPSMNYARQCAFVRDTVAARCAHRHECADIVLYLADLRDARTIIRHHGAASGGPGQISALQSRASYLEAAAFAAELAEEARRPPADEAELPDLHWTVIGGGLTRVATAKVQGKTVVVRMGGAGRPGVWVVNVNEREACAQFAARADAMSKMGVGAALAAYDSGPRIAAPQRGRM